MSDYGKEMVDALAELLKVMEESWLAESILLQRGIQVVYPPPLDRNSAHTVQSLKYSGQGVSILQCAQK